MIFRTVQKSGQIFVQFCHNPRVRQTDGQTDRQTDRRSDRILIARPRLHSMHRAKNVCCRQGHNYGMFWVLNYPHNKILKIITNWTPTKMHLLHFFHIVQRKLKKNIQPPGAFRALNTPKCICGQCSALAPLWELTALPACMDLRGRFEVKGKGT